MNAPNKIIIHASATDDDPSFSWGAIRDYHMLHNGWLDIGYHAGCELVGDHHEVMYGRPWSQEGAHCPGQNAQSLGFCFVGNFEYVQPHPSQLEAAVKFLRDWLRVFKIAPTEVYAHREFNATDCPGAAFPMTLLKAMLIA